MRRLALSIIYMCASSTCVPASAETVADLMAQLAAVKPDLEAVVRVDANLVRSVARVDVSPAEAVPLPEPRKSAYFEVVADPDSVKQQVAVIGGGATTVAAARGGAQVSTCSTTCAVANLQLVDVSCNPPHGSGPDGRQWVRLVCGDDKAPTPYDWQLARLSGALGDIFAWDADPTYAYVQGANGSYQASALTSLGQLSLNFSLPTSCASRSK